jgi:hypothetical protein
MTPHSEEHFDELLQLLEWGRAWSARIKQRTMSEVEKSEHRECVGRINNLVLMISSPEIP